MAYVNLPNSLNQMFSDLDDRISRIETGYNGPMQYASSAQSTAITASSSAATAAAGAAAAQAIAATAIQKDSYNIFNASNQLTAINGNGITVYAGSSPTTGARVVLNSNGLTGTDGSTTTFAINASTGNVSLTGALVTGGSISGSSISIGGGNFSVTSGGVLTAVSGSVGGWTLRSTYLTDGSNTFLYPVSSSSQYSILTGAGISASSVTVGTGVVSGNTYSFSVGGTSFFTGNMYYPSHSSSGSGGDLPLYVNSSGYIYAKSSSKKFKEDIQYQDVPIADIVQLKPVTYVNNEEYAANNNSATGLKRVTGLIAEDVAQIDTLKDLLVGYDEDGAPFSISYDAVAVALIPAIKNLNDRLTALEAK